MDVVDKRTPHTVHLLQQIGDKVRLVRMVEGRDVELELVGDLQECKLTRGIIEYLFSVPEPSHPGQRLRSNGCGPDSALDSMLSRCCGQTYLDSTAQDINKSLPL